VRLDPNGLKTVPTGRAMISVLRGGRPGPWRRARPPVDVLVSRPTRTARFRGHTPGVLGRREALTSSHPDSRGFAPAARSLLGSRARSIDHSFAERTLPSARDAITHRIREPTLFLGYFGNGSVVLAGDEMWYRVGADLVVVIHLLFIGFVVGGAFLTWRWPRIAWAHIPAVMYGALIEFAGFTCPLTVLENNMRLSAGEAGYSGGFVDHYLIKVIYPPGLTHGIQIGLGVLVLLLAAIGYWGFLRRHGWGERRGMRPPMRARPKHRDIHGHHGQRGHSHASSPRCLS
jgi:hypothetical protein